MEQSPSVLHAVEHIEGLPCWRGARVHEREWDETTHVYDLEGVGDRGVAVQQVQPLCGHRAPLVQKLLLERPCRRDPVVMSDEMTITSCLPWTAMTIAACSSAHQKNEKCPPEGLCRPLVWFADGMVGRQEKSEGADLQCRAGMCSS